MTKVAIGQLKDHISHYIHRAEAGETVVIVNRGREVAVLRAPPRKKPGSGRLLGCLKGSARVRGEIVRPIIPAENWFRS